jgi:NADH dehydrogenase
VAEEAVRTGPVGSVVVAPSLIYAPGDPWLRLLSRLSLLPVMPISGRGRAVFEPIWAEDVAECVMRILDGPATGTRRVELAGPERLTQAEIVRIALRSFGKRRLVVGVPTPIVSRSLRVLEVLAKSRAFATWDEAELLEVSMTSAHGSADAEGLGVFPRSMAAVLGVGAG